MFNRHGAFVTLGPMSQGDFVLLRFFFTDDEEGVVVGGHEAGKIGGVQHGAAYGESVENAEYTGHRRAKVVTERERERKGWERERGAPAMASPFSKVRGLFASVVFLLDKMHGLFKKVYALFSNRAALFKK